MTTDADSERLHKRIAALAKNKIAAPSTESRTKPSSGEKERARERTPTFRAWRVVYSGKGEVGCIITSGVLISQQSPEHNRGAIIGTFNLSGAIGILVASVAGGWLFDHWREPGPFVVFGLLALAMMGAAVLLSRKENSRS